MLRVLTTRQVFMELPMQVNPSYGVSPGNKGAAGLVAQSSVPGPGVSTSNLDLSKRRVVKRGSVVSYHGLRCKVDRVRLGFFWGQTLDVSGRPVPAATLAGSCHEVQVVS